MPFPVRRIAPRKEGRPHNLFSQKRFRNILLRLIVLSVLILTIFTLLHSSSESELKYISESRDVPKKTALHLAVELPLLEREVQDTQGPRKTILPAQTLRIQEQAVIPPGDKTSELENLPTGKSIKNHKTISSQDTDLEEALRYILSLLPNELTTRGLLAAISGTGKEKLREVGMRTKAYRLYLDAWKALHITKVDSSLFVRDDIIQYLREHEEFATSLTKSYGDTIRAYEQFRHFIQRLGNLLFPMTAPYFPDHMSLFTHISGGSRGIVMTGGDIQAPFMLTSIISFRRLGCDLPVEIIYRGEHDLSEDFRSDLENISGVVTRDLSRMVVDAGWEIKGWALKPWAILLSSFREVIFIDADALFFQSPDILFEDPLYKETGTLFFKDRIMFPESKKELLTDILPHPISKSARQSRLWTGTSGHMQESGVVVVDKSRYLVALLLVCRMNGPDRDGDLNLGLIGIYDMVYGDKETYWLAWELVGSPYAFHEGDVAIMGVVQTAQQLNKLHPDNTRGQKETDQSKVNIGANSTEIATLSPKNEEWTVCAPQLLHLDKAGKPLWFNGWILSNKYEDPMRQEKSKFDVWLKETPKKDSWQLYENNKACLTSDTKQNFSVEEKGILDMILKISKEFTCKV